MTDAAPSPAAAPVESAEALQARLARVRLLLCDVDGVLTDGTVWMGGGTEFKRFNIQDGLGLRLLQKQGIRVGWISNRPSDATRQRAEDLKIDFLHQSSGSKVAAAESILAEAGVAWDEVCYIGDDVVDLGMLQRAGVPVAVANAIADVKSRVTHVTRATGGQGAVREVVEMILKAKLQWTDLIQHFLS